MVTNQQLIELGKDGLLVKPNVHDCDIISFSWIGKSVIISFEPDRKMNTHRVFMSAEGVESLNLRGVLKQKIIADAFVFHPPHERFESVPEFLEARGLLGKFGYDDEKIMIYMNSTTDALLLFCADNVCIYEA
jgi:hypothetical protein